MKVWHDLAELLPDETLVARNPCHDVVFQFQLPSKVAFQLSHIGVKQLVNGRVNDSDVRDESYTDATYIPVSRCVLHRKRLVDVLKSRQVDHLVGGQLYR